MANEITAGAIALELTVKDKVGEQIDKIRQSVSKPAQDLGKAIEDAVSKPVENVEKTAGKAAKKAADQIGKGLEGAFDFLGDEANGVAKALEGASDDVATAILENLRRQQEEAARTAEAMSSPKQIAPKLAVGTEDLEKKLTEPIEQAKERLEELGQFEIQDQPAARLRQQLENVTERIEIVQGKWQELQQALVNTDSDAEAAKIAEQLNRTEGQLLSLTATADKLRSKVDDQLGGAFDRAREKIAEFSKYDIPDDPVVRLWTEIGHANTKMSMLQKQWQELSAAKPTEKVTAQLIKTEQQIISTRDKLDKLHGKLSELESAPAPDILPEATAEKAERTASKAASGARKAFEKAFGKIRSVADKSLGKVSSKLSGIGRSARSAISPVEKLGNMLKRSFKRVFFAAGIYAAFRALKNGLSEAMQANDEFAKSLNAVKANLSIAFTPILQAIMPALNTMMSGLATVTKQIAGFIAGLFGKTYSQAAAATKKLKGVTDAAKKASMATAGIDEMNILGSSDSDSGSDSGGTDYSAIDDSEPELPDWAQRLKEAIKSGDWAGVGSILAERVNSAFEAIDWEKIQSKLSSGIQKVCDLINGFTDKLDWSLIGKSLGEGINTVTGAISTFTDGVNWSGIGSGITKGLNKAIATVKWSQLGKALSAKYRILTDVLYSFVTEFDWTGLGNGIGQAVNGWFEGIDFGKAGTTLSEGLKGIFDSAKAALDTVDYSMIGGKISEFVNNIDLAGILSRLAATLSSLVTGALTLLTSLIQGVDWSRLGVQLWDGLAGMVENIDWSGIVSKAFELAGSVLGASASLLVGVLQKAWGALQEAWNSVKEYFNKKIEEHGGNIIAGVMDGILTAMKNIGKWIKDHILEPFVNGFMKAFGIKGNASDVMAGLGDKIVQGIHNAVHAGIDKIRQVFVNMLFAITNVFTNIKDWFHDKFSEAWTAVKLVFSSVGTFFSNTFSSAWTSLKEAFSLEKIGEFFGRVWTAITNCFSKVTSWFKDTFSKAWQAVKDVFSKGGEIFKGITTAIADTFKNVVNSLIDGINNVIAVPFEAINDALWTLRNWELWTPWGDFYPFEWLPEVGVPQIPHLAGGGLATAPTLAMVGDNRNAAVDPEVISPLSKLQDMIDSGSYSSEIVDLLRQIVDLLRNGLSAELIGSLFGDSDLRRVVLRIIAADNASKGGSTW